MQQSGQQDGRNFAQQQLGQGSTRAKEGATPTANTTPDGWDLMAVTIAFFVSRAFVTVAIAGAFGFAVCGVEVVVEDG